jgi:hypothetical protein
VDELILKKHRLLFDLLALEAEVSRVIMSMQSLHTFQRTRQSRRIRRVRGQPLDRLWPRIRCGHS